jgi:hypothetical protein
LEVLKLVAVALEAEPEVALEAEPEVALEAELEDKETNVPGAPLLSAPSYSSPFFTIMPGRYQIYHC